MPLTLTLTAGVLLPGQERVALRRLTDAMLKWTGLTGNKFIATTVVGSVNLLPPEHAFGGPGVDHVVFIEWKVPPIAFTDREVQAGYIAEATDIVHELSGGRQRKEHIWVNIVHAVDGGWGIAGRALTCAQLEAAIALG